MSFKNFPWMFVGIIATFFIIKALTAKGSAKEKSKGKETINWRKEWADNNSKLKELKNNILLKGRTQYFHGNNEFKDSISESFNNGYYICRQFESSRDTFEPNHTNIKFYMVRSAPKEYSAFIFSNDSSSIMALDQKIAKDTNDRKLEENWYIVNDF